VEFLGRHRSTRFPAALERVGLSGRTGSGIDPCAAIQTHLVLQPEESIDIIFCLGEAEDQDSARELVRRFWDSSQTEEALKQATRRWDHVLEAVHVRTPDPAFDLLMNRWLLYQVISCRLWARSAFYQSAGAYGMRDQLQDVMALVHAAPELTRDQILRAASRQFVEGDVQHWWHSPAGRGVRTRIADDLLWLAHVTAHYISTTGDTAILDEPVSYLESPALLPGQDDAFGIPATSGRSGSLYEHCTKALERGFRLGPHDLPLMGSGDWNDGMNRVGAQGRGESVWLAWFLADCLRRFAAIAMNRGEIDRAAQYHQQANDLREAVEQHAWDGSW
jgi:cyclic beta-1,2-glucan synthetase